MTVACPCSVKMGRAQYCCGLSKVLGLGAVFLWLIKELLWLSTVLLWLSAVLLWLSKELLWLRCTALLNSETPRISLAISD